MTRNCMIRGLFDKIRRLAALEIVYADCGSTAETKQRFNHAAVA